MTAITTRTLTCGMPLRMEPMSGVRSVGLTWLLPAGSATDPEERQGLSALWSELLLRGAGDLDSRAQADAFDTLGTSRSADVATLHMRLSATLLGDRLLEALGLIVEMVRRPRMEADAIEASRDLALQGLEGLKDDEGKPVVPGISSALVLMVPAFAAHPQTTSPARGRCCGGRSGNPWPLASKPRRGKPGTANPARGNTTRSDWRTSATCPVSPGWTTVDIRPTGR